MTARTMMIERLTRIPASGIPETLEFDTGVNVIVGGPNAGKTKWLRIVDFVLGDTDSAEDALGSDIAAKYTSASVALRISDPSIPPPLDTPKPENTEGTKAPDPQVDAVSADAAAAISDAQPIRYTIERRWKEQGVRSKIFVNGEAMTAEAFSDFILGELRIPALHFPKGDPYSPRAWPALSWRMLFRHVYRQERFWSDLADKQPDGEQHACLTQFLGIAQSLFSEQYGELVDKRKHILALEARKDSYMDALHRVSADLSRFAELSVAITPESVTAVQNRLSQERDQLDQRRAEILKALGTAVDATRANDTQGTQITFEAFSAQLAQQRATEEGLVAELARLSHRTEELTGYHRSVSSELKRLERAQTAGEILSELKVTHCPVCDQQTNRTAASAHECYLCRQPYNSMDDASDGAKRLAFEVEQLRAEDRELAELLQRQASEHERLTRGLRATRQEVQHLDAALQPTRAAAAAILPPDLTLLDQEAGRINEQLRTLDNISRALDVRDSITGDIDSISAELQALEGIVSNLTDAVDFERAANTLADGFNTYFNSLNTADPTRWPEGAVAVRIRGRQFDVTLDGETWKPKLGATYACFFLNGYHYALLSLSGRDGFNYPGFAIVDFPPTLADGRELTDEENYLIEPYVDLLRRLQPVTTQLIVAGRAFVDLTGARRIELSDVWR